MSLVRYLIATPALAKQMKIAVKLHRDVFTTGTLSLKATTLILTAHAYLRLVNVIAMKFMVDYKSPE